MKTRFFARSFGLASPVFLFLFLLILPAFSEDRIQVSVSSGSSKAKDAFDRFAREPSSLTAREFYVSLFSSVATNGDKTDILDHIFGPHLDLQVYGDFSIIGLEAITGDIYAIKAAIRLLDFIDDGWQKPHSLRVLAAGRIGEALGELIRAKPAYFLRACYEAKEIPYMKKKGLPVGFIPPLMKRTRTRASYELEMRREALRSVEEPELRLIRDECINAVYRELVTYGPVSPDNRNKVIQRFDDPREEIKNVFAVMQDRPDSQSMKRILALFSDVPNVNPVDITSAMFPPYETFVKSPDEPFGLILREARCANESAIEVLFRTLIFVYGMRSMEICSDLSNLILIKPTLFIEKLAKYEKLLNSVNSLSYQGHYVPLCYFEWLCVWISSFDYPYQTKCENVILRRRIAALVALNIPEHKELIGRCIRVIENRLNNIESVRPSIHDMSQEESRAR